ncbi:hypothetical protein D3C72_2031590 [compost metagenome]
MRTVSIQFPKTNNMTTVTISLGMKVRVISWIWVATCRMLTRSPTIRMARSNGAATIAEVRSASLSA